MNKGDKGIWGVKGVKGVQGVKDVCFAPDYHRRMRQYYCL